MKKPKCFPNDEKNLNVSWMTKKVTKLPHKWRKTTLFSELPRANQIVFQVFHKKQFFLAFAKHSCDIINHVNDYSISVINTPILSQV